MCTVLFIIKLIPPMVIKKKKQHIRNIMHRVGVFTILDESHLTKYQLYMSLFDMNKVSNHVYIIFFCVLYLCSKYEKHNCCLGSMA